MLHRFVRMSFQKDRINDFKKLFHEVQPTIESFEGCQSVQLLEDADAHTKVMTFSIWEDQEALDRYRDSEFFITTWRKTKVLFEEKAEAFSMFEVKK
ncbi:antibiotic biosynthesis monooxygenase [Flammeovirga yaeyamensis]|uniref:Antibiotic biosynthesis monooxygenase n=1 Tax=Flammeovirga yaeyamensis TaxID=367791 RepID=A0AAX1N8H6_9BACT|nr:antibiotic biosynthesis monooxygenase family protein [Flammeovirga yaeyamensis]MBB3699107.1 hypothetical protein [Flammeovirga yaeyamensis]NMF36541.1 antibiotic biosynthesis monooxygenase [Flammeovirga yaeyamensis]QWG03501.1 antibiotic biosynthesis monooxygenase [Flammeovirga yaeyamensis]